MKKKIPKFSSEEKEHAFWAKEDSTDYIDWSQAQKAVFPNLKPSLKTISLRLPESMVDSLKFLANKNAVGYQSLLKIYLAEKIAEKMHESPSEWLLPKKKPKTALPKGKKSSKGRK